jgi:hypothetical protein
VALEPIPREEGRNATQGEGDQEYYEAAASAHFVVFLCVTLEAIVT